jgi:FeS assembly SUF system regulator
MLRISRLTDYGIVVMAYLASHGKLTHTAKDIAFHTRVNLPTVSKLLKQLTRSGFLHAQRGSKGGYGLALSPEKITLADIIRSIEGEEIALTPCGHGKGLCEIEKKCGIRNNWLTISIALRDTLSKISLAEMNKPIEITQIRKHFNITKIHSQIV